ncbi:hypothetical protein CRENBAI_009338 [Crenichthys baileyi]|uniref:Uncharacterized protein n=1 Tax=Crenichthys baileyi TaxID=28760 RepID=A0AAV9RML0_9TELE
MGAGGGRGGGGGGGLVDLSSLSCFRSELPAVSQAIRPPLRAGLQSSSVGLQVRVCPLWVTNTAALRGFFPLCPLGSDVSTCTAAAAVPASLLSLNCCSIHGTNLWEYCGAAAPAQMCRMLLLGVNWFLLVVLLVVGWTLQR